MVTISVTRFRVAVVLRAAADTVVAVDGWDADLNPIMRHIDAAAGYTPGKGTPDAMDTTLLAFDALSTWLGCPAGTWERMAGRTQVEVCNALREAAQAVTR